MRVCISTQSNAAPLPSSITGRITDSASQDEVSSAAVEKATSNQLTQRLDGLPAADENASVEIRWCRLRDAVQSADLDVPGRARHQHQGWFNENDVVISHLLAEKNRQQRAYLDRQTGANEAAFNQCRRPAQQRLRGMQDSWMTRKAEGLHAYDAIKAIYDPPTKRTAPLLSSNGSALLMEKSQILKWQTEHFIKVLNIPSTIANVAIDRLPPS
ncbi:hypothetical protein SprV_0100179100 [Sparganum proliferum]